MGGCRVDQEKQVQGTKQRNKRDATSNFTPPMAGIRRERSLL